MNLGTLAPAHISRIQHHKDETVSLACEVQFQQTNFWPVMPGLHTDQARFRAVYSALLALGMLEVLFVSFGVGER